MTQPAQQGGGQQSGQQQQAGTQQGTGEQQQGSGQQQGTEGQQGNQPLGLLDEQAQQQVADDGQQQGEQQQGGTGQSGTGQQQQTGGASAEEIASIVGREVDRRMTALYREVRGGGGGQQQQGQQNSGQQQGQQGEPQQQQGQGAGQGQQRQSAPAGPSESEVREARLVYREYVGDEIKFLGTVEREHATTLAGALLRERLGRGDDPDTAGREAAKQVASTVKALRQHYESQTVAALQRRGLLPVDGRGPGQPNPGPPAPGAQSGFAAGAAKAATLFADRMPQQPAQQGAQQ